MVISDYIFACGIFAALMPAFTIIYMQLAIYVKCSLPSTDLTDNAMHKFTAQ